MKVADLVPMMMATGKWGLSGDGGGGEGDGEGNNAGDVYGDNNDGGDSSSRGAVS